MQAGDGREAQRVALTATLDLVLLDLVLPGLGGFEVLTAIRASRPTLPVILLTGWFVVVSSPWIELAFFDGSMRQWFTNVGIPYDQRNALIVGMAMGFAVIPTIFSIAEDAVFSVPRHLTQGSLALGATPW
jgi:phosphate transport system permease protein